MYDSPGVPFLNTIICSPNKTKLKIKEKKLI